MKLTDAEREILESGGMASRMMRLLVRLGEVFGAARMVPVGSVQISGVSYKSIGDPGLEFLEDVASQGAGVRVLTTLNPAGMDIEDWRSMGVPRDFAARQGRILAAFRRMGVETSATCTPYLVGNVPYPGEHLAWAESSAVSYANSVLGARTNREGGPSALASAICGCTPEHGLHLEENRGPTHVVRVEASPASRADHGALGYHVGRLVGGGVPFFRGLEPSVDDLKALGAAMAASGAVALYHVESVTPEAHLFDVEGLETLTVTRADLDAVYSSLTTASGPDLVVLGCPHASMAEIEDLAARLAGRKVRVPLWICTSRAVKEEATRQGLTSAIEDSGARVVADTCMVVAPVEAMGIGVTAVSSAKAAHYLPGMCKQGVVFADVDTLLGEVLE